MLRCVCLYGSSFVMTGTLITSSIVRYIAICHSFLATKLKLSSMRRSMKIILLIWFAGLLCAVPGCKDFRTDQPKKDSSVTVCEAHTNHILDVVSIAAFILPMLVICVTNVLIGIALKKSSAAVSITSRPVNRRNEQTPKILRKDL